MIFLESREYSILKTLWGRVVDNGNIGADEAPSEYPVSNTRLDSTDSSSVDNEASEGAPQLAFKRRVQRGGCSEALHQHVSISQQQLTDLNNITNPLTCEGLNNLVGPEIPIPKRILYRDRRIPSWARGWRNRHSFFLIQDNIRTPSTDIDVAYLRRRFERDPEGKRRFAMVFIITINNYPDLTLAINSFSTGGSEEVALLWCGKCKEHPWLKN